MLMIDVYAVAGTFREKHELAQDLAKAVMKWENVPASAIANAIFAATGARVRDLPIRSQAVLQALARES